MPCWASAVAFVSWAILRAARSVSRARMRRREMQIVDRQREVSALRRVRRQPVEAVDDRVSRVAAARRATRDASLTRLAGATPSPPRRPTTSHARVASLERSSGSKSRRRNPRVEPCSEATQTLRPWRRARPRPRDHPRAALPGADCPRANARRRQARPQFRRLARTAERPRAPRQRPRSPAAIDAEPRVNATSTSPLDNEHKPRRLSV